MMPSKVPKVPKVLKVPRVLKVPGVQRPKLQVHTFDFQLLTLVHFIMDT